jgi:hypothetical protein
MVFILDSALGFGNLTTDFAAGLAPIQADNTVYRAPYTAADLDEETARSIALAIAEIETARREAEYDAIVEEENRRAYDRLMDELAEQAEMDARLMAWCD